MGSPHRTSAINSLNPMYKRTATMIGDQSFILGRRSFFEDSGTGVPSWSYLYSYQHRLPGLGTCHESDFSVLYQYTQRRARESIT